MKIITVAPLKRGIKKELTYFAKTEPKLGSVVSVPIRKKFIDALVIDTKDLREYKSAVKISDFSFKKVQELKGQPVWSEAFFRACHRAHSYFTRPLGEIVASFIPKNFIENINKLPPLNAQFEKKNNLTPEKLALQLPLEERLNFYKTFIRESFARKSSVFFCLPRISDIEFFKKRLETGLLDYTFAINSSLSAAKQIAVYKKIMTTDHPVIIFGTASFLFLPRPDIGTIIIEKESAEEFETVANNLDGRIFAELLAMELKTKLIFADTLLRLETIERVQNGILAEIFPLNFRINKQPEIIKQEKWNILELPTYKAIQSNHAGQVFLFALRKGLATLTICHDCGQTVVCAKCQKPLVLHGPKRTFICHSCRKEQSANIKCSNCQGWNLVPLGIGIEKVYEEIKKDFPNRQIFISDTEKDIKEFLETPGGILIGGENTLAYLNEPVDFSAVISFDTLWNIPDFRMNEKIMRIVVSLLEKTKRKTIIQTRRNFEMKENLLDFVREELELRKKYNYPPFTRLIEVTLPINNRTKKIQKAFEKWAPEEWVYGRKMTLIFKVPIEEWNFEKVPLELWEKLINLPPNVFVVVQ